MTSSVKRRVSQVLNSLDLDRAIIEIQTAHSLERLSYHFRKHGEALGCATEVEYVGLLDAHLARNDLRFFVLERKQGDLMWYAVAIDTGNVAQYNQTQGKLWSFYRSQAVGQFVSLPDLTEVQRSEGHWRVKP